LSVCKTIEQISTANRNNPLFVHETKKNPSSHRLFIVKRREIRTKSDTSPIVKYRCNIKDIKKRNLECLEDCSTYIYVYVYMNRSKIY